MSLLVVNGLAVQEDQQIIAKFGEHQNHNGYFLEYVLFNSVPEYVLLFEFGHTRPRRYGQDWF
jgi:hypothetical protein